MREIIHASSYDHKMGLQLETVINEQNLHYSVQVNHHRHHLHRLPRHPLLSSVLLISHVIEALQQEWHVRLAAIVLKLQAQL